MRTAQEWLNLPESEQAVEVAEVFVEKPWKHKWDSPHVQSDSKCIRCKEEHFYFCSDAGQTRLTETPCSVPDPIDIHDLGEALRRFRKLTKNQRFDAMLDIARLYQPNGEYANMPVDRMQEVAEYYCLQDAPAVELWIIVAMSKENS